MSSFTDLQMMAWNICAWFGKSTSFIADVVHPLNFFCTFPSLFPHYAFGVDCGSYLPHLDLKPTRYQSCSLLRPQKRTLN